MAKEFWVFLINWAPLLLIIMVSFAMLGMFLRWLFLSQIDSHKQSLHLLTVHGKYKIEVSSIEEAQLFINMMNASHLKHASVVRDSYLLADMDNNYVLQEV